MQAGLRGQPSGDRRDSGSLGRDLAGVHAQSVLCTVGHLTVQPAVLGIAVE